MTRVFKFFFLLLLALDTAVAAAVSVAISPAFPQAHPGDTIVFSATVSGTTNSVVIWSLSCPAGGNACGQIRSDGTYTAPPVTPNPPLVTVTATSLADLSQSASTQIFIGSNFTIGVSVSPTSATVLVNKSQKFTASVTNTGNTSVTWSVTGSDCAGSGCGTVAPDGIYTAPATVPNGGLQVTVTATSNQDHTKSASASVTIPPVVMVSVAPTNASIVAGTQQQFTATVTGTNNPSVTWSLSGPGCAGAGCGSITTGGLYTAPTTVPSPAQVSVTATSVADPTKSSTVVATILPLAKINISPANVQVVVGHTQQFTVIVTGTGSTAVTFSLSGLGCTGSACGTITSGGLYTAPGTVPKTTPQVTVTATLASDNTKTASATVTIIPTVVPITVTVSPNAAQVLTGTTQQFTAVVTGTSNTAVTWSVKGAGCSGAGCGTISSTGLYTAPGTVPSSPAVTVTATSNADSTKSDTAAVTLIPPTVVTISPKTANVLVGHQQQFTATVVSNLSHAITWRLLGPSCSGAACGTLSSTGLYTAPATTPVTPTVTVTAILTADPNKSDSAVVTIIPPVAISISPTSAQVVVGHQRQFSATDHGSPASVTWTLTGSGCSGSTCGSVSTTGLFTAPGAVPSPATVTVTATSTVDTTKAASATVTILPPVVVTVSPSAVSIPAGDQQQFTATVTGSNDSSVTWHLSGAGTLTSAGLYTAPNSVPNPPTATITATSNADPTKSASAKVTILSPPTVTILPNTVTLAVNDQQQFHATILGNPNSTFTWSLSGPGCSGASCGTITTTGLYTAPPNVLNPATVIVKAALQSNPVEAATANVTIVATDNAKFAGPFAFNFTGFETDGVYETAGSFTADGAGKVLNGLEDTNGPSGPQKKIPFTGTYHVASGNRVTLTIDDQFGTHTYKLALNEAETSGRLIEFDNSGRRGSGVIEQQDPTAFKTSSLSGNYVLALSGNDVAGARLVSLGTIFANGAGAISAGSLDVNDGGDISPTFSFRGTINVDSTGRGTMALSIPGFEGGNFNLAFYVVSVSKFLIVSVDPLSASNPIIGGLGELQTGTPFLSSIFRGPAVFSLSGTNGKVPDDIIGRVVFDGISQLAVDLDENNGGKVSLDTLFTGVYDVQINGRGVLDLDLSSPTGQRTYIAYATGPNRGFLMDGFSSAASLGELVAQTAPQPYSNSEVFGGYLLGSGEPVVSTTTLYSGEADFDGTTNPEVKGVVTGIQDISEANALLANQPLSGTYGVFPKPATTGQGRMSLPGRTIALWLVTPNQVVGLDVGPSVTEPVILHFEQ